MLTGEDLADALDGVNLRNALIPAKPHDSGKAQGVATVVAPRALDVVEGHFKNYLGDDLPPKALIVNGPRKKELRHLANLHVGQARIGFADVHEPLALAHCECVVR